MSILENNSSLSHISPTEHLVTSKESASSSLSPNNISQSITATTLSTHTEIVNHQSVINTTSSQTAKTAGGVTWFEMPKMDNFVDIFSICCSTAVIFGGLVPYIPQYLKIKRAKSSDGFSTYVCLTLLIANILRIMFWFGHHFETPLLIQSFVMIAGMLAMMEICIRVRDTEVLPTGLLTYLFRNSYLFVESLGFVAVFAESMLGMPQLLRNYAKSSCRGMSVEMVVMWLSGDLFKTLYFIIRQAPAQFYVCGSVQVVIDILILCQALWYRQPNATYRQLPKST